MTADLSGIRSLLAGITPGEWEVFNRVEMAPENDPDILATERGELGGEAGSSIWVGTKQTWCSLWPNRNARADAAFIAAAPSTVARLLGIVERVEALHVMELAAVPVWQYGIKSGGEVCGLDGQAWPCETITAITGEGGADGP